jgi:hypothetical protein
MHLLVDLSGFVRRHIQRPNSCQNKEHARWPDVSALATRATKERERYREELAGGKPCRNVSLAIEVEKSMQELKAVVRRDVEPVQHDEHEFKGKTDKEDFSGKLS